MPRVQDLGHPLPMKRFLVGCGALLALCLLLVVGLYVVTGVQETFDVRAAEQQAVAEIEEALPDAERRADRLQRSVRAAMGRGAPEHSWRELSCSFSTIDAGWIVQDYEQVCELHTVDLFPVDDVPASGACDDVPEPVTVDHPLVVTLNHGPTGALTADNPWRSRCPSGITEPALPGSTRVLAGGRPDSLSASPAWIVAETRTPVSRTTLGCHPWKPIFCSTPVEAPALPG